MWKKNKKPMDERIEKESNRIASKHFYIMLILVMAMLLVKIICKLPFYMYVLEVVTLLSMVLYVMIKEVPQEILFLKNKDEAVRTIHESILAKAFNLGFKEIVYGELILLFFILGFAKEIFPWIITYFIIWFPSAIVITKASTKKGLLIWGSRKNERKGKKELIERVIIGSLFFGIITCAPDIYHDGSFHVDGILMALGMGTMWGILFYFLFTSLMKKAEKNADRIEEGLNNCEKQEIENSESRE